MLQIGLLAPVGIDNFVMGSHLPAAVLFVQKFSLTWFITNPHVLLMRVC